MVTKEEKKEAKLLRKKKKKKPITENTKKAVLTAFILLFPSLIIAGLTTLEPSIAMSILAIALFFYQAVLIKNFLDDHYKSLD